MLKFWEHPWHNQYEIFACIKQNWYIQHCVKEGIFCLIKTYSHTFCIKMKLDSTTSFAIVVRSEWNFDFLGPFVPWSHFEQFWPVQFTTIKFRSIRSFDTKVISLAFIYLWVLNVHVNPLNKQSCLFRNIQNRETTKEERKCKIY